MIATELASLPTHGPQIRVELRHVPIGIGEHKTGFVGGRGAVPCPLLDKCTAGLVLGSRPVDGTFRLIDAKGVSEIAFGHHRGRPPLLVLMLAGHLRQRRSAIAVLQRTEHAAAIDTGELPVVTDQDELRVVGACMRGDLGHQPGVDHSGFVHHDDSSRVPLPAPIVQGEELTMNRGGLPEAIAFHVLGDGIGRRQTYDRILVGFIGLADRAHGEALPGSGLAVDQSQTFRTGRMQICPTLISTDGPILRVAQHGIPGARVSRMAAILIERAGRP